jgi:hypothetical protein
MDWHFAKGFNADIARLSKVSTQLSSDSFTCS